MKRYDLFRDAFDSPDYREADEGELCLFLDVTAALAARDETIKELVGLVEDCYNRLADVGERWDVERFKARLDSLVPPAP